MDEFEVWVCVNEEGEYAVGKDAEDATNGVLENHGATALRTICLKAMIARPEVTTIEVTVPDEAGETVQVAEAA
jgi:hypothetical protein